MCLSLPDADCLVLALCENVCLNLLLSGSLTSNLKLLSDCQCDISILIYFTCNFLRHHLSSARILSATLRHQLRQCKHMFSPPPLLCPQWLERCQASEHPTGAGRGGIKCPESLVLQATFPGLMFLFALWSGLNLNDDVDQSISAVSAIRS